MLNCVAVDGKRCKGSGRMRKMGQKEGEKEKNGNSKQDDQQSGSYGLVRLEGRKNLYERIRDV